MLKRGLCFAATVLSVTASAQVVLSGPGPYNQNFDSLASAGLSNVWNDNLPTASMPGWYSTAATYDADYGNLVNSGQYSYGSIGSGERALGSVALNGAILRYGMRINNASGGVFGSVSLSYVGEQWRTGSTSSDVLLFEYSTNATSLNTGVWNPVAALDFNSPNNSGAGAVDGNLAANRSLQSSTITGLNWLNGSDMWVRWSHIGNQSGDGLGLDDVQLSASPVPEPATFAILGLGSLGLIRRRKG